MSGARGLAARIRDVLISALGRGGVIHQFDLYRARANQRHCATMASADGARFGDRATVQTWGRDRTTIAIGAGSEILGEVKVYPSGGAIVMGRGCFLGENSRIWSMERVAIGDHVLISHNCTIMDTDGHELDHAERAVSGYQMMNRGLPLEQGNIVSAPVSIGDHVWIGIGSTILKGVTIGARAIVAAGSVVTKDVPAGMLVAGNPARVIRPVDPSRAVDA